MFKRISLMLVAAITMVMMAVGPAALAAPGGGQGGGSFTKQCEDAGGTVTQNGNTFSCTQTVPFEDRETKKAGNSGRQFDVSGNDATTTSQQGNSPNVEPENQNTTTKTTVTSCENPGEREINPDNPNCQLTGVPGQG